MSDDRVEFELTEIEIETGSLPKLEKLWPGQSAANRYVFHAEWHNLMGALENLEDAYRAGAMTPEQERRYQELKALLEESVPILKRLGFTLPPVPLGV